MDLQVIIIILLLFLYNNINEYGTFNDGTGLTKFYVRPAINKGQLVSWSITKPNFEPMGSFTKQTDKLSHTRVYT